MPIITNSQFTEFDTNHYGTATKESIVSRSKAPRDSTLQTPKVALPGLTVYEEFYDSNGLLHYKGHTKDGLANGKGVLFHRNGAVEYDGNFVDNLLHGRGNLYSESGNLVFRGDFVDGIRNGNSFFLNELGIGVEYYANGDKRYEGQWTKDKWHGFGKYFLPDGRVEYEGNFIQGMNEPYYLQKQRDIALGLEKENDPTRPRTSRAPKKRTKSKSQTRKPVPKKKSSKAAEGSKKAPKGHPNVDTQPSIDSARPRGNQDDQYSLIVTSPNPKGEDPSVTQEFNISNLLELPNHDDSNLMAIDDTVEGTPYDVYTNNQNKSVNEDPVASQDQSVLAQMNLSSGETPYDNTSSRHDAGDDYFVVDEVPQNDSNLGLSPIGYAEANPNDEVDNTQSGYSPMGFNDKNTAEVRDPLEDTPIA
jgi:hypothetical protein